MMLSNHLILCHLFLLLPSIFPNIRIFSMNQLFASGGQWIFNFTISPSKESVSVHSVSVHSLSRVRLFATPWTAAHQASLSRTNARSLPKLMSIELVMPSNHLILCHPLLLPPAIFPNITVLSNKSVLNILHEVLGLQWILKLSMNIQDWSLLGWTGWISLQSKGLSRVFSNTTVQKHQFLTAQLSLCPTFTSIHDYWKNHSFG